MKNDGGRRKEYRVSDRGENVSPEKFRIIQPQWSKCFEILAIQIENILKFSRPHDVEMFDYYLSMAAAMTSRCCAFLTPFKDCQTKKRSNFPFGLECDLGFNPLHCGFGCSFFNCKNIFRKKFEKRTNYFSTIIEK